jgi:CRP-like cAMP-binding protein
MHRVPKFLGSLHESVRILLKKPPSKRSVADINYINAYFSSIKSLEKYSEDSRKLFAEKGEYETWEADRIIIKQDAIAESFYILLDGEVSATRIFDKDAYEKALANLKSQTPAEILVVKSLHARHLVNFKSGDSFGEIVFNLSENSKRFATIATVRPSEFLVIHAERTNLKGRISQENGLKKRIEIITKSPILKTLAAEPSVFANLCKLKSLPLDSEPAKEEAKSDFFYIICAGSCAISKQIDIRRNETGKVIYTLANGTHLGGGLADAESYRKIKTITLNLGELHAGDWFGEGIFDNVNGFNASALMNHSYATITAQTRVDVMMIQKVDLSRYATSRTWQMFQLHSKQHENSELHRLVVEAKNWLEYKEAVKASG